jgi:hypothetical protein
MATHVCAARRRLRLRRRFVVRDGGLKLSSSCVFFRSALITSEALSCLFFDLFYFRSFPSLMYDVDSITLYTSYMNGNAPCHTGGSIELCLLRKLNVPGDRSAGVDYIRHLDKPSLGDVRWVRMKYSYARNT